MPKTSEVASLSPPDSPLYSRLAWLR
ncbi:hypothetical protein SMALA_5411 [Streptomyces malaysiensis subsp. malaysiensis]|nr:hypothetical protein SMALA_5411 [Streptomyces malaysiensis]